MNNQMNTFDFAVRLDDLILGCIEGGNTPEELQEEMREAIKALNEGGELRNKEKENAR